MINNSKELREWVSEEKKKIFCGIGIKGLIWCYLTNDHWIQIYKYQKYLRHELYHRRKNNSLIHRIKEIYYCRKKNSLGNRLGFYIGCEVFDRGLVIYHHGNIIVNGTAKVGKNCILHGDNCIGNDGKSCLAPVLGDYVELGVGAKVIGNITISNNITIAAGAVVVNDFLDEGITIAGVPARRIK